jgi:5-methylcytosine-specific restriction endonuclease McrA
MSIVSSKSCTRCSEMKPLTDYSKDANAKDGHKSVCKICRQTTDKKYREENREARRVSDKNYYKNNKEARSAYDKDYANKNKEAILARAKKYRENNKDKIAAYKLEYYAENKEALSVISREIREKNKEAIAAYKREYQKNNRSRYNGYNRRRKARKLENGFEVYTEAQVLELYGIDCHLCMEPIDMDAPRRVGIPGWERGLHFDHVIAVVNGGPDNLENIRPSHAVCNLRKGSL